MRNKKIISLGSVLFLVVSFLISAVSPTGAGSLDYCIDYETCHGTVTECYYNPDPTGNQRFAMAHMLTTTNGGILTRESLVSVMSMPVPLSFDPIVTTFFQTHPTYKNKMGASDTWIAFSSPYPVSMQGFMDLTLHNEFLGTNDAVFSETRVLVFSLIPHTYTDTDDLTDSILNNSLELLTGSVPHAVVRSDSLTPRENGRYISDPLRTIPSDPAGAAFETAYLPKPGDLIITEIMKDPNGDVPDATGEWFEVLNASNVKLNLYGVIVRDNGSDYFSVPQPVADREPPVVLSPGQFAVFGKTKDARLNGGLKVDIAFGSAFGLSNTSDEIILEVNGIGEIDRAAYDAGVVWPNPSGKSMELTDTNADNNDGTKWAVASKVYGNKNQKGTPGKPYNVASDTPPIGNPGIIPAAGSLVITELNTQPRNVDQGSEWFEIFNPMDTPVILTNMLVDIVSDTGVTTTFQVNTQTILDPLRYFVFTQDADIEKGGLPFDYDYPDNFSLYNDRGTLKLKTETGVIVDEVSYDGDLFTGFPDYGNGVSGGWPMPSEYNGRTVALKGSLNNLRDTTGYNNNTSSNWALTSSYKLNPLFGKLLTATPGAANVEDLSLTLSMPSQVNVASLFETFGVTITPQTGYAVSDIDTQSIRLFWSQRPTFLKITASDIRADFKNSEVPAHIERNVQQLAYVTADYTGDSPLRFLGTASFTPQDTSLSTPASFDTPAAGEILITEIMVNPAGNEDAREYFELYNTTASKTFNILDLGVQDGGGATIDGTPEAKSRIYNRHTTFPLRLGPGDYAVVGRNYNFIDVGRYEVDGTYLNQDLNFSNTGDQVVVFRLSDGGVVSQVDYEDVNNKFPDQNSSTVDGRALSLVHVSRDASKGQNWVNATIPFGDSGYGTPSEPNRLAAKPGDAIVTEVYANPPPGGEPNAEFFEIYNPDTTSSLDLAGLIVIDDNGNTFTITDKPGLIVSGGAQKSYVLPDSVIIFGNSRGASDGVDNTFDDTFGADITGYDYLSSWTLTNTTDAVRLVRKFAEGDTTEIHGMKYTSTSEGKSWGLDNLSDTLTYGLKTPNPTLKP